MTAGTKVPVRLPSVVIDQQARPVPAAAARTAVTVATGEIDVTVKAAKAVAIPHMPFTNPAVYLDAVREEYIGRVHSHAVTVSDTGLTVEIGLPGYDIGVGSAGPRGPQGIQGIQGIQGPPGDLSQSVADTLYVHIGGSTMTGPLTLSGDPLLDMQAATKRYVDAAGGGKRIVTVLSGDATALAAPHTDYVYVCTTALNLNLPTAVGNTNRYTVKRTGTGNVTVSPTLLQLIDDSGVPVSLDVQYMALDLVSDGSNWVVV